MKKIVVPLLLLCYLAVTSGVMVNFHYCMNRLASTELYAAKGKQCGTCKMDIHASHGCCRDEVTILKMEEDQQVAAALSFELSGLEQIISVPSAFITASFNDAGEPTYSRNHSPPLLAEQSLYLRNRVFRI